MQLKLNDIIGTIQVHSNGSVWMIPRTDEYEIVSDYLNLVGKAQFYKEQRELITTELKMLEKFENYNDRFSYFENKLGGMDLEQDEESGWLSRITNVPNLLFNINTTKLYLAREINDKVLVDKNNLLLIMEDWLKIVKLCGSSTPFEIDNFDLTMETRIMASKIQKY